MRRLSPQRSWLLEAWNHVVFGTRRQRKRQAQQRQARRFRIEQLESRNLLAATDLAAIEGRVFDDFSGNGYDLGEEIAGATINLYEDDGDGVFEPGADDTLVATEITDAEGLYRFDDLTAGDYFVHQPDQTVGTTTLLSSVSPLINLSAADVMGVPVDSIDSFDTSQSATASSMGSTTVSSSVAAAEALGGERDLYVELTSPNGQLTLDVNGLTPGALEFQASSTATGQRIISWDGADGDAATLDATGLGGIDLTDGGTATALSLTIGADQNDGQVTVRVYSDAANFSTATIAIPNTGGIAGDSVVVRFADFTIDGGTGADFTNVGAIQIEIAGVAAVDGQLDTVETLAPTVETQDFDNFESVDVSLTKSVDNASPTVGQDVTFTITVANAGPQSATNVAVTDVLPAGLTFVSATATSGSYSDATGIWTIGTIASGADEELQITATVATPGTKVNTAEVTALDQFDVDSTPDNGNPDEDDQASVSVSPAIIDLSLEKTVDNAAPNVGDNVTFTVDVTNAGPDSATGVMVEDVLPAGVTFVSATASQGEYDEGTGIWDVGTLAQTETATLTIVATVTTPGTKTNTAQISAADQADADSTPDNDDDQEDDQDSVAVTPLAIDLSLTKTVDVAAPNVGQQVTFTITVSNAGPDGATNVAVEDALPAGLTFVSADPSQGSYDNTTGVWTVGSIASTADATLEIVATVSSLGAKTNTAQISAADQADADSTPDNDDDQEDDQDSVMVTPQQIDLSLTKTVDVAAPNVGENVTFTIEVSNAGPDSATNVVVTDQLPAGMTFVSMVSSQGTYNAATGIWAVGTIASGGTATLDIVATPTTLGAKTNTAQVTSADQADVDSTPDNDDDQEDDQDSVVVTPQQVDLSLTKTVTDATPDLGSDVTFTITVSNAGPNGATNVEVTDLLPAGLTFVSSTASAGSYNSATGVWTVGSVASGGSVTLDIVATVATNGVKTNTAQVTAADQADIDSTPDNNVASEDDQASVNVTPNQIDLALTKTANTTTPLVGSNVTFTITVSNTGTANATGVTVLDELPAGLTFLSATPSQGTFDSATGIWTVGAVNTAASATLQLVATVTEPAAVTNSAQVQAAGQEDIDSTPGNSDPGEDDIDTVALTPRRGLSKRQFLAR